MSVDTIQLIDDLAKRKIIAVVKYGEKIGIARWGVNTGRDSFFRARVVEADGNMPIPAPAIMPASAE
jgi:hypothetical protein